jgi:serine/threonine protein kinase
VLSASTAAAPRSAALATPTVQPRYRFDERLGAGGMAEVFRGTMLGTEGFERAVAIKRILPGLAQEQHYAGMFVQEAHVGSRLSHPNIVSVLDFERAADGQLLLVLEFVDGVDLAKLLEGGPLPIASALFVVSEILCGLAYAHNLPMGKTMLGVVHRDLSPHNILLSWEGAVKIADFGLAKPRDGRQASASLVPQGKYAFMSPEQIGGHALDGRSDLFSVGALLWEMLTGERLFGRDDAHDTIWRVLDQTIPRPSSLRFVPPDIDAVVMKLLKRSAGRRYRTAEAALAALMQCDDVSSVRGRFELAQVLAERFPKETLARRARPVASVSPALQRFTKTSRRRPQRRAVRWWPAIALVAALCVALAAAALVRTRRRGHPPRQPDRTSTAPEPEVRPPAIAEFAMFTSP